jgi:AcrR family transcriptional regulator
VGVDAIASEAGTNKMSFYRSFASKDELVAEYLRGEECKSWQRWDETVAAHAGDPRAQVEALFDAPVRKITCKDDARGCALAK